MLKRDESWHWTTTANTSKQAAPYRTTLTSSCKVLVHRFVSKKNKNKLNKVCSPYRLLTWQIIFYFFFNQNKKWQTSMRRARVININESQASSSEYYAKRPSASQSRVIICTCCDRCKQVTTSSSFCLPPFFRDTLAQRRPRRTNSIHRINPEKKQTVVLLTFELYAFKSSGIQNDFFSTFCSIYFTGKKT